jgi:hypothetical protein
MHHEGLHFRLRDLETGFIGMESLEGIILTSPYSFAVTAECPVR